jgi:hypothetical protein
MGRATGTGDDHLDATRLGFFSVLEQMHSSSCLFSLGARRRIKKQQATQNAWLDCTNYGQANRPKAAQYTSMKQINSPHCDHLSPTAKHRIY